MSLAFILSTPLSVPSRRGARAPRRGATARLAQLPKSANVRKERLEKVKQISQTVLEQDSIESTPFQRNLLYVFVGLTTYEASHIICSISSAYQAVQCVFSMVASYIVCDFAVAFYHHAVDNYGNGDTPIFGSMYKT